MVASGSEMLECQVVVALRRVAGRPREQA